MRIFKRLIAVIGLATAAVSAPASATTIFLESARYAHLRFLVVSLTHHLAFPKAVKRGAFHSLAATSKPMTLLGSCHTAWISRAHSLVVILPLGPISSFVSNATKQRQLAALLRNTNPLFAATTDVNAQSRIAASVALGVWEIVYEAGVSGYSVTNGDFSTFGDFVDIQAQTDSYLAAVLNGPLGNIDDLGALVAFDNQSQVFLLGGGGGGIPEPATWAMMIFGFGMIGAALRRQREQNSVLA